MDVIGQVYDRLLGGSVIVLAVLIILSIIRSVRGPGIADRIIAVNMIGTMIIMIIAILSVYLDENYLVDVCLIYAMLVSLGWWSSARCTRVSICRGRIGRLTWEPLRIM